MTDAIIDFISDHGYWAIALLMFVENIFPPIPSELIMPFAGYSAASGDLSLWGVVAAGVAGSLLGGLPWFLLARRIGSRRVKSLADRHGRWLTVSRDDIERAERWFQRHGALVLVLGRLVPGVRTVVAVPAGLAGMGIAPFLAWSTLGAALWSALLAGAGYALESRYESLVHVIDLAAKAVIGLIVVTYVWRVVRG